MVKLKSLEILHPVQFKYSVNRRYSHKYDYKM